MRTKSKKIYLIPLLASRSKLFWALSKIGIGLVSAEKVTYNVMVASVSFNKRILLS